ncbi:MFS transporter [Streptomyces sp. NRRL S-340]|uniref:MFS transporter n=1 Tax=Streptomyces sp. NRRL S-340 TaxID=1463901 RepID=UPI000AC9A1A3|nr:MFS transporter [Streptomyces sp. NRRL S-340]
MTKSPALSSVSGYHRVIAAAGVSAVGDGIRFAALPLLSAALLDDAFEVSVITAATTVPWLLLGLPAGAYADRFERSRLMVLADLLRAGALIAAAALLACGRLSFWPLLVIALLLGVGEVLFDCASFALLPSVVPEDRLEAANGRLFAVQNLGRDLLGHLLGGVLFAVGRAVPLLLDACSFVVSAALLRGVRGPLPDRSGAEPRLLAEIREGVSHVARDPLLRALTVAAGLINAVFLGQVAVFVILVRDVLGLPSAAYGVLVAGGAAGGLAGSAVAGRVSRMAGRVPSLLGALALIGAAGLGVAATDSPYVVAVAYSASGAGLMVWNVVAVSMRQRLIPDRLLGRATGVYRLFAWGTMPIGALLFGALTDAAGPRTAFAAGGAVLLVLSVLVAPTLLRSDRTGGDRQAIGNTDEATGGNRDEATGKKTEDKADEKTHDE